MLSVHKAENDVVPCDSGFRAMVGGLREVGGVGGSVDHFGQKCCISSKYKKLIGFRRSSTPPSRPILFHFSIRFFSKVIAKNQTGQIVPD